MQDLWYMVRGMAGQRGLFVAALIATVARCILVLMLPLLMADAVDAAVIAHDIDRIASVGWRMLAVSVCMGACGYASNMACAVMGQRFARDLRERTYDRISELTVQQALDLGHGSLITRLTVDIDVCADLARSVVRLLVEPVVLAVGGICMLWSISASIGLVLALFVLVQMAIMVVFIRMTAPGFVRVRHRTDALNAALQAAFGNFRLIKAFNTQRRERDQIDAYNQSLFDDAFAVQRKIALFNPLIMLIMNLAVASLLVQTGDLVLAGTVSAGLVLSSINYAEQVLLSIAAVGRMYRVVTEAQPSAARVREVLMTEPGMTDGALALGDATFERLSFEDVCFSYPGGGRVFEGLSFSIDAGECLAVVGPIGCGKTTLASLCARLYDATSGMIALNGEGIQSWKLDDVRREVALVEKHTAVMEDTLRDNIVFGRTGIDDEDVNLAVSVAQLDELVGRKPKGLDTRLFAMGKSLSGGERQRLTIARALAGRPSLLVLDDSTSSLDYVTEARLLADIHASYPHMAVLLITNRLASALRADRILVLDEGRAQAMGTDAELRRDCGLFLRMCSVQEGEA